MRTREDNADNFQMSIIFIDYSDNPDCKIHFGQMQIIYVIVQNMIFKEDFFGSVCCKHKIYQRRLDNLVYFY